MKKLIIITGELATGKSTLADRIAKRRGIPRFRKDDLKEILADNIGFADREQNRKLSVVAVKLMDNLLEVICATDGDLILEANFRQEEYDHLTCLARKRGYKVLTISMTGDDRVLYERYAQRSGAGRHSSHLTVPAQTFEVFTAYQHQLLLSDLQEPCIRMDTTDPACVFGEEILQKAAAFLDA